MESAELQTIANGTEAAFDARLIPLESVDESPTNPRQHFDPEKLGELAASIREHGVRVPIRVRPRAERYELIGGARRVRAARMAGLAVIPAVVEEISDHELLVRQLEDNANREDVHPLEEALAFQRAKDDGWSVEEIARRLGKGKGTSAIYGSLKMTALIPECQRAFFGGGFTAAHAVEIARLRPRDQALALDYCTQDASWNPNAPDMVSVRELKRWIKENCHLSLIGCGFDPADETLLPITGACTTCPQRSGANPELLADIGDPDICTDSNCYRTKRQASDERRQPRLFTPAPAAEEAASPAVPVPPPDPAPNQREAAAARKRIADEQKRQLELRRKEQEKQEAEERKRQQEEERQEALYGRATDAIVEKISWPISAEDFAVIIAHLAGTFEGVTDLAAKFGIDTKGKPSAWRAIAEALPKMAPDRAAQLAICGVLSDIRILDGAGSGRGQQVLKQLAKRHGIDLGLLMKPATPPAPEAEPRLAIECPQCHAKAGESCTNYKGQRCHPHGLRKLPVEKPKKSAGKKTEQPSARTYAQPNAQGVFEESDCEQIKADAKGVNAYILLVESEWGWRKGGGATLPEKAVANLPETSGKVYPTKAAAFIGACRAFANFAETQTEGSKKHLDAAAKLKAWAEAKIAAVEREEAIS